jgi:hypothetical protein
MNHNVLQTPEQIARFRLCMLIRAARLEQKGMRRKGRSALSILKHELGITGSAAKVIAEAERKVSL